MGRKRNRETPPRFGGKLSPFNDCTPKKRLPEGPPRFGGDKLRRLYDGTVKKVDERIDEVQKGHGGERDLVLNAYGVQKGHGEQSALLLNADEVQKGDGGEHDLLLNADEVQKGDGGEHDLLLNADEVQKGDGGEHDLLLNADEVQKGDGGEHDLLLNADEVQKGDGGQCDMLLNADQVQKGDSGEGDLLPKADEVQKGDGGQSNMLLNDGGEHNDLLLTADELKNKAALSKAERLRLFDLTFDELLDKPKTEWTDKELLLWCTQYTRYKISEEDGLKEMPNLRKYLKQLDESEGFDITGPLPRIGLPQERICPVQLKTKKHQKYVKKLAELAIESYNDNNEDFPVKTDFQVVQVKKVTMSSFHWNTYYVTFTAKDESPRKRYKSPKTFQAEVAVSPSNERIVEFCRLKAKR